MGCVGCLAEINAGRVVRRDPKERALWGPRDILGAGCGGQALGSVVVITQGVVR